MVRLLLQGGWSRCGLCEEGMGLTCYILPLRPGTWSARPRACWKWAAFLKKLLRILRQQWQSPKPRRGAFWAQDPVELHNCTPIKMTLVATLRVASKNPQTVELEMGRQALSLPLCPQRHRKAWWLDWSSQNELEGEPGLDPGPPNSEMFLIEYKVIPSLTKHLWVHASGHHQPAQRSA